MKAKNNNVNFAEDVVAEVKADFANRQKMRRPYELAWQLNMNFVMGNQYCVASAQGAIEQEEKYYFWQEKQVFNHIAPIVETRLARLNRVRPRPIVRPFTNSDADVNAAKLTSKILRYVTDKTQLSQAIGRATNWSEVCGTAFYKVSWDSQAGDVGLSVCSPFEIYPNSNVTETLDDCTSVIHAKVYPAEAIRDIWGIDVAGTSVKVFGLDGNATIGGLGYSSATVSVTQEEKQNQALVIERYTKPTRDLPFGRLEIVAGDKLVYFAPIRL